MNVFDRRFIVLSGAAFMLVIYALVRLFGQTQAGSILIPLFFVIGWVVFALLTLGFFIRLRKGGKKEE